MTTSRMLTFATFLFLIANSYSQSINPTDKWKNLISKEAILIPKDCKDSIIKYDFAPLWTNHDNRFVYGFIGKNYQRIRVKIISAVKDKSRPDTYSITGKTMVKENICQFKGTIKITEARMYENIKSGVDGEFVQKHIQKEGILIAEYHFKEDKKQNHSGVFDGLLSTAWYVDSNNLLKYDDIEFVSDSYCNNQFAGTWKDYNNNAILTCNWGDFRIPESGDFDIGAGEFSPAEKYLQYGWQGYRDAYSGGNNPKSLQEEQKEWWK